MGWRKERSGAKICAAFSREYAVGHACMQVHVVVQHQAKAVQERDGTDARADATGRVVNTGHTGGHEQRPAVNSVLFFPARRRILFSQPTHAFK